MGIEKLFKLVATLVAIGISLVFTINSVILFNVKSDIIRLNQLVITYAHSNGGFIHSPDKTFENFFNQSVENMNLSGKITNVTLSHPIGVKLQKGTEISIKVTPKFSLVVPFTDKLILIDGKEVERTGITRIYYKDLI